MKIIYTENAPAAIGPYSQAFEVNGFVYTSGQIPVILRMVLLRKASQRRLSRVARTWEPFWKQRV